MEAVKGGSQFPIRRLTIKSPSDREDWSGVTFKFRDDVSVTMKYPSDNEDFVTMKAPSDNEEI